LVAAAKFLVAATKKLFVAPNLVAVTKPFFPVYLSYSTLYTFRRQNPCNDIQRTEKQLSEAQGTNQNLTSMHSVLMKMKQKGSARVEQKENATMNYSV